MTTVNVFRLQYRRAERHMTITTVGFGVNCVFRPIGTWLALVELRKGVHRHTMDPS